MSTLTSVEAEPKFTFEGINHRLFIEGRGFDFRKLSIDSSGSVVLKLDDLEDRLYSLLDFEEPSVIYVVSRQAENRMKNTIGRGTVHTWPNGSINLKGLQ